MSERPSGYYWVRYRDADPQIAKWIPHSHAWLYSGEYYGEMRMQVLFGPIPGPEELAAMAKNRVMSTGRFMFFNPLDDGPMVYATKEKAEEAAQRYIGGEDSSAETVTRLSIYAIGKVSEVIGDAAIAQAAPEQEKP